MQDASTTTTGPDLTGHPLQDTIRYFAAGMGDVTGFLTSGAAAAILTVLEVQARDGIAGPMAEIGTFHGKTLIGLGLALREQEAILGVDLFVHNGMDFEATLRANCARYGIREERLRLHRGPSTGLGQRQWRELLGAPARFVHVDGEHTRSAVRNDLALAAGFLAPSGAILVDDVLHPWFPDVTLGVADFLNGHPELRAVALFDRQGPMRNGGPKLLVTAVEDEDRYKQATAAAMRENLVRETEFCTSRPLVFCFDNGARKRLLALG